MATTIPDAKGNQTDCCITAGQFDDINIAGCLISANFTGRSEIIKECGSGSTGDVIFGPTIGSLSITAYANGANIHRSCQGKAGVSIPWTRHYDCGITAGGVSATSEGVIFIKAGSGSSFVAGDVLGLATIIKPSVGRNSYPSLSISSQGGPSSIGTYILQTDGAGLNYTGEPSALSFNSSNDSMKFNFSMTYPGGNITEWYLQSFNLEVSPGELPIASYSFTCYIDD